MIRHVGALALCGFFLACSGTTSTGAPPPPPKAGLPTAPPALGAEPTAEKRPCSCRLKLKDPPVPANQPLAPISGDLPQGPFDLERRSACTAPVCRLDGFVPDAAFLQTTREGVPAQGAVWLETIADKSVVQVPRGEGIDSVALVLEGTVIYGEGDANKATPRKLGPWGALRVPNAGYFVQAHGGRASVLMAVTARSGSLADAIGKARPLKMGGPGSERLEVSDVSKAPKQSWGGGAYHARVAFGSPGPVSVTLIQATGTGSIPENVHAAEWEHIAVLRGGGEMLLGDSKYALGNASLFQVPSGTTHGWTGSGQELAAVLFFSPGGPEQRFIELGAAK